MSRRLQSAIAAFAGVLLVIAMADATLADSAVVRVDALADPWFAGQSGQQGDGILPAEITLPEGISMVSFPRVSGSWSNVGPMVTADGVPPVVDPPFACGGPPPCIVLASQGLSGLRDSARFWYLTGVFIGLAPGSSPPPSIDFTNRHEFTALAPALDQVFFIGDGRTSLGVVQKFRVPRGATRLLLGMVDICMPGEAAGCYFDNSGSLEVTPSWGMPDTATLPAPIVPWRGSSWQLLAMAGAVALLAALRRRPRPR